jgi:MFS family permease
MTRPAAPQSYAFVIAAVVFVALLCAAALRSSTGVLMTPWEKAFGWNRAEISTAAAVGIFLYGLAGPFAAAVIARIGVRKTLVGALALMSGATALTLLVREPWQLVLTWGLLSGLGSGFVAMVLGASVVNTWFVKQRGLMTGLLGASTATGSLIFMPLFGYLAQNFGWRPVVIVLSAALAVLIPLVLAFVRNRPADIGALPFGADPEHPPPPAPPLANPAVAALAGLVQAARRKDFWLLFSGFFICGLTTNGLVGTHMISLCTDHGLALTAASGLMAAMGVFDIFGTTASGWLTDRVDARKLLFVYYGLRGLSLIYLPFSDFSLVSLSLFAVFYGLDWIATVPPTLRLANQAFGEAKAPIVFGWVFAGHQLGAAAAAFMGGALRTATGSYLQSFVFAGAMALLAAVLSLLIGNRPNDRLSRASGPAPALS